MQVCNVQVCNMQVCRRVGVCVHMRVHACVRSCAPRVRVRVCASGVCASAYLRARVYA